MAEDNSTNREVILAQLKKLGYNGEAVTNGIEAVEAVRHGGYELLLMDCAMPIMDGYEATHSIRQSTQLRIPIIALTASAMSSDRERCLSEGMDDYLAKPVELPRLAAVLTRWLPDPDSIPAAPCLSATCESPAVAIFDPNSLLRRLMNDRELAGALLKGFLNGAPAQLQHLRERLDDSDAPGLRLEAHTLNGAAATVAAEALHLAALAIETAATAGQLDSCRGLLGHVTIEFDRFKTIMEQDEWVSRGIDNTGIKEDGQ